MERSLFSLGNEALRSRQYTTALGYYNQALLQCDDKFFRSQIKGNITYIESQLHLSSAIYPRVDVIIPVYNAIEDVKICLESVVDSANTHPIGIIIVNDGSDVETSDYLRLFASRNHNVTLIDFSVNRGYTKTINTGLRASSADYLVTLNSDTIVPNDWIPKLLECINSDSKIGIVGPLSNAASWQNFPSLLDENGKFSVNELPEYFTLNSLQKFIAKFSASNYPRVSFVNGFCFMIKRSVIDSIGYMDEESFPIGYGEENDFCLRAQKKGFDLAIAVNSYVFHSKSKSFGHSCRQKLSKEGTIKLKAKHGHQYFNEKVEAIKSNQELKNSRLQLRHNLLRLYDYANEKTCKNFLKIGFILPASSASGGANSVIQEAAEMFDLGYDVKVYVSAIGYKKLLTIYRDIQTIDQILCPYDHHNLDFWHFSLQNKVKDNIHFLAKDRTILISTLFSTVKLLKSIVKYNKNIIPAYYAQDYEPLFFDPDKDSDLYNEARQSYELIPDNLIFAKTNWIRDQIFANHSKYVYKVKPSIDETIYFPVSKSVSRDSFNILAMIRPSTPRRNASDTMNLLSRLKNHFKSKVNIQIFGCMNNDPDFQTLNTDFEFINHQILTRPEVSSLTAQSDLFIDLSTYQAFGRTGLEAMACGCISILPKIGGADEYIQDGINSFMADYSDNGQQIVDIVDKLINDCSYRTRIRNNALDTASNYSLRSAVMSELNVLSKHAKRCLVNACLNEKIYIFHDSDSSDLPSDSSYIRFLPLMKYFGDCTTHNFQLLRLSKSNFEEYPPSTIIFHRFYSHLTAPDLESILSFYSRLNAYIIYDIDLFLFDTASLLAYGVPHPQLNDIEKQIQHLISFADVVSTSYDHLRNYISRVFPGKRVIVNKSMFDYNLWFHSPSTQQSYFSTRMINSIDKHKSSMRVGFYSTLSSISHKQFSFIQILDSIASSSDNTQIDCIGSFDYRTKQELQSLNIIDIPLHRTYPSLVHWLKSVTINWDFGAIYCEDNDHDQYQIKTRFLEYAILGLPIIISKISFLESLVINGVNCICVDNSFNDWQRAIQLLSNDAELRQSLSLKAYHDASSYIYTSDMSFQPYLY